MNRKWNSLRGPFGLSVFLTLIAGTTILIAQSAGRPEPSVQTRPPALDDPAVVRSYQQMITPEGLASRLYFLASDFFEGRETTTRGQKLAAEYLASQYRQLGLKPAGTAKTADLLSPAAYFQPFTVYRRTPKETHLEVTVSGKEEASSTFSAHAHDDLSYFLTGGLVDVSGGVIFAGYGINDDKLGYNDYAALRAKGISLADKWVLILEDEPLADASTSLLPTPDHKPSSWSQFINKKRALWDAKPKGVLVVSDVSPRTTDTFSARAAIASLNARRIGNLGLTETSPFPPTYAISTKLANQILAFSGQKVEDLRQEINKTLKPVVFGLADKVKVTTTVEAFEGLKTENVLALIEGSDPKLKDEVVIVSAHYDHLGINPALKGDQIYNGAADDGSGIVACMELAQQFMKAKRDGFGPRRSILFINFTGEEKGLLGSGYYTRQEPIVPWEETVADINMDGVGGIDPNHPTHSKNYIYILGTENLSRELIDSTKSMNARVGTNLELTEGKLFSSDQYNFETQLVPYIYYSTGYTDNYHQPSDEPNTIAYDHLARIVRLIFATAWQVANKDTRPASVDRNQITLVGYVCPPCPFECDDYVYEHPGECPVCGMNLVPRYSVNKSVSPSLKSARTR